VIVQTRMPELRLLPVGPVAIQDTAGFGVTLHQTGALERLMQEAAATHDIVLVDTPSGFGSSTMEAMRVGTHVLSPLQAEPIALRSLTQLLEVVAWLREQGAGLSIAGLVLTMLHTRDASSLGVAEEVWTRFPGELVLETTIPRDPAFLEASTAGVPVGLLRRRPPPVTAKFLQAVDELEVRMGMREEELADAPIALVD
jgi:chromosome partitioning protein